QTQDAYKEKPYTEVKEIAKEIKADLCKDPEAYVWVAVGHRKDQDDVATYGWYKTSESKKKTKEGKEYELSTPARDLPGNQARVRAIKRWVREVFPEAKAKMKEMTATWMDRAGDVRDIQNVIEAEYHIVTEAEPLKGGGKIGESAAKAEEVAGEGFSIDLTWLKESRETLKWSEDTMLTFIISQYKVSGTSVTGALNKLTREQAEDFVNQINTKVEKQASLF
ncbi:hypothetical protein LCGC14_2858970, partial [marine sediment metagenome]